MFTADRVQSPAKLHSIQSLLRKEVREAPALLINTRLTSGRQCLREASDRGLYCREPQGSSERGRVGDYRPHRSQVLENSCSTTANTHIHSLSSLDLPERMG